MKRIAFALCAAVLVAVPHVRPLLAVDDLTVMRLKYDEQVKAIDAQSAAKRAQLMGQYATDLNSLASKTKLRGDLDGVLAIRAETDRFLETKTLTATNVFRQPGPLYDIQTSCLKTLDTVPTEKARSILLLWGRYDAALLAMEKRLMVQDNMAAAIQVRQERERVQKSAEVTSSQFIVGDCDSKDPPPTTSGVRGMCGSRSPSGRDAARRAYGGSDAAEAAVLRALRWLKTSQNADGSWNENKCAMTSFALLTYLAHGETPASEEFGQTVEKAIRFLMDSQQADGRFLPRDGNDYTHPIATYALCEAYGMTDVPMLKTAAEKAVDVVIKGQHPNGGFNYNLNLKDVNRNDSTYMSWCCQALKAAKTAGCANSGLQRAIKHSLEGWRVNMRGDRNRATIGYTSPGDSGLTGAATLCLQLLGAGSDPLARGGMMALRQTTYNWQGGDGTYNKLYYWYYITQAMFNVGGGTWTRWNTLFATTLVANQIVTPKAIVAPNGEKVDIGHWAPGAETSGHTDPEGKVMNTCLCALQLEVYYRSPPTFKQ